MRIIQIGQFPLNSSLIKGGVEASIYGLSKELSQEHEVYVIDTPRLELRNDFSETIEGIKVFRFNNIGNNNFDGGSRLKEIVNLIVLINPDLCHIHGTNRIEYLILKQLQKRKVVTALTVHGLAHIEKQKVWRRHKNIKNLIKLAYSSVYEFFIISSMKSIIVDTEYVRSIVELYFSQSKIWHLPILNIIPQGIDSSFFNCKTQTVDSNILLSVGAINRRKGHHLLLQSFKIAHSYNPNLILKIAGVKSDNKYFNLLTDFINENGLMNAVSIFSDISTNELQQLFMTSSLFVLHSQEESQGIVFCEAMAVGLPIVATNVGGVPFVVKHDRNGFLSEYGDVEAFAEAIIKLTNDKMLSKTMKTQNIQDSKLYDWSNITVDILSYYKSLL